MKRAVPRRHAVLHSRSDAYVLPVTALWVSTAVMTKRGKSWAQIFLFFLPRENLPGNSLSRSNEPRTMAGPKGQAGEPCRHCEMPSGRSARVGLADWLERRHWDISPELTQCLA
jgi:hypothetical protein